MDISEISSRVIRESSMEKPTPNCPGGIGSFGFNSYDLLTFALLGNNRVILVLLILQQLTFQEYSF